MEAYQVTSNDQQNVTRRQDITRPSKEKFGFTAEAWEGSNLSLQIVLTQTFLGESMASFPNRAHPPESSRWMRQDTLPSLVAVSWRLKLMYRPDESITSTPAVSHPFRIMWLWWFWTFPTTNSTCSGTYPPSGGRSEPAKLVTGIERMRFGL